MNIGIVGLGVVGKAIYHGFTEKGHTVYMHDTADVEKEYQSNFRLKEELMEECSVIFICVPTPSRDNGACDLTTVFEVFGALHRAWAQQPQGVQLTDDQPIIAIKSTCIPGTVDTLKKMYPWVCSNPEFLRAEYAVKDFLEPDRIIIGADKESIYERMANLYEAWTCPKVYLSPREAETVKYLSNAYLLLKVAYSEEARILCTRIGVEVEPVMEAVVLDHRIDESHLKPLGAMPKDSVCLPKDALALIQASLAGGYDPWLLKAALYRGVEGAKIKAKLEVEL